MIIIVENELVQILDEAVYVFDSVLMPFKKA